jgi:hypothetical protein
VSAADYRPADQLYLWLLTVPADPVPIGELSLVRASRGVSLRYADAWLERGFALSEDLPLIAEEFLPPDETAAGAVDDARPDRWGERLIRFLDKPPRLSLLEYYFAGDDRSGARRLDVGDQYRQRLDRYRGWRRGPSAHPQPAAASRCQSTSGGPCPRHDGGARPTILHIDGAHGSSSSATATRPTRRSSSTRP